jgi:hypothetical protein
MLQEQCAVDDEPCIQQQAILRELANPGERRGLGLGLAGAAGAGGSPQERPYEVPFDKRAMDAVLDAINMGLLPSMKVGQQGLDVYVLVVLFEAAVLPAAAVQSTISTNT